MSNHGSAPKDLAEMRSRFPAEQGGFLPPLGATPGQAPAPPVNEDLEQASSAPIVKLADRLIQDCIGRGAKRVFVLPVEESLMVYYELDGKLETILQIPASAIGLLPQRLMMLAHLDPSGQGTQYGTIEVKVSSETIVKISLTTVRENNTARARLVIMNPQPKKL
jgi:type II secretory ATPase GspE/PulE/Tfp pilus assembly ATPase PilB-like protein